MELRSSNFCLSFIKTLWKGEVILCCFNNLSKEISDVFCTQIIEPDDLNQLENLIHEFMFGGENAEKLSENN
jgi:hypothetical protein